MNEPNVVDLFQGQDRTQAQILLDRQLASTELLRAAYFFPRKSKNTDLIGVLLDRGEIPKEVARQIRKQLFQERTGQNAEPVFRHDGRDNAVNPTIMWGPNAETRSNAHGVLSQLRTNQSATISVGTSGTQTRFGDLFDRRKYEAEQDLSTRARLKMVDDYNTMRSASPSFAPHADLVFEHRKQLGVGGMGVVHQVVDNRLGREAALKVMRSDRGNRRDVGRFIREAKITARLDHPAIPPVFEAGTNAAGQHFMLMQVINGEPFSDILKAYHRNRARKRRDLEELLQVLVRVGEALSYAHNQGIVHRDIKPSNVMVGRFGEVMVMDWGIATDLNERQRVREINDDEDVDLVEDQVGAELTQMGAIMGTVGYMPPEQARGEIIDERADVFALGAMLSKILTNQTPFDGLGTLERLRNAQQGRVKHPLDRNKTVSKELNAIAAAALHPKVEFRTASVAVFTSDIKAFLAGYSVSKYQYNSWERLLRAIRANPLLPVSVVVLIIIVLGSVQLYTLSQNAAVQQELLLQANQQKLRAEAQKAKAEASSKRSEELKVKAEEAAEKAKQLRIEADEQSTQARQSARRAQKAAVKAQKETERAEKANKKAAKLLKEANKSLANLYIEKADRTLQNNDSLRAEAFLSQSLVLDAESKETQKAYLDVRLRGTSLKWSSPFRTRLYCLAYQPPRKAKDFQHEGLLAGAGEDSVVYVWDPISGQQQYELVGFTGQILSIQFHPNKSRIAACGKNGNVFVWDYEKNSLIYKLSRGNEVVNSSLAFSQSGQQLIVSGIETVRNPEGLTEQAFLRVWDLKDRNLARRFKTPSSRPAKLHPLPPLNCISVLIDGKFQLYRSSAGVLQAPAIDLPSNIVDVSSNEAKVFLLTSDKKIIHAEFQKDDLKTPTSSQIKVKHQIQNISVSKDSDNLACFAKNSKVISVLNCNDLTTLSQYRQHDSGIAAIALVSSQVYSASNLDLHRWRQDNGQQTKSLVGHGQTPRAVAISDRAKLIASAGDGGRVLLWNSETGQLINSLTGHKSQITALALSPDQNLLASASADRTVILWDLEKQQQVRQLKGPAQSLSCLDFHPSGQYIAAGVAETRAKAPKVHVWDVKTGKLHYTAVTNKGAVEALYFDLEGKFFAVAGVEQYSAPPNRKALNRSIKLWSFAQNAEVTELQGHKTEITGLASSPDGRYLVSSDVSGKIIIWDPNNGVRISSIQQQSAIKTISFTPTGAGRTARQNRQQVYYLVTAGSDQKIHIWDFSRIRNLQELVVLSGHQTQISDLAVSRDGRRLVSVSKDRRIKLWEFQRLQLNAHKGALTAIEFNADASLIASGSIDRQVRFWDTKTGSEVWTLKGRARKVEDLVFFPNSSHIAISDGTGSIEIWNYQSKKLVSRLDGHKDAVTALILTKSQQTIISASRDSTIRLWSLNDKLEGKTQAVLRGHSDVVSSLSLSADERTLYSGSWDRSVRVWDMKTAKQLRKVKGITEPINSLDVAQVDNSIVLATASQSRIISLYNLSENSEARLLRGHSKLVNQIQFIPGGRALISASVDGTLKVWNSIDGQLLLTLDNQKSSVTCFTTRVANSKLRLASGSIDAKVRFWNVETVTDNVQGMVDQNSMADMKRKQLLKRSDQRTGFRVQDLSLVNIPQNHLVD